MRINKDTFTVLSLFDGGSGGQLAFKDLGINFDGIKYKYFASEIKKHAIKLTKHHFPNTIHIGDVTKVSYKDGILYTENGEYEVGEIDILIGGSPCQNFSILNTTSGGERFGLNGDKSKLFYEYLRIKNEINPSYFFLENVRMKPESEKELNDYLNTNGVHANSSLVSFQTRPRIYWSNAYLVKPDDMMINFQDFKDTEYDYCKQFKVNRTPSREKMWNNGLKGKNGVVGWCKNVTHSDKVVCVTRKQDRAPNSGLVEFEDFCRYLTRRELELAQTMPIGYTDILSYGQAQDIIGDGWTIKMISHFFKQIIEQINKKYKID